VQQSLEACSTKLDGLIFSMEDSLQQPDNISPPAFRHHRREANEAEAASPAHLPRTSSYRSIHFVPSSQSHGSFQLWGDECDEKNLCSSQQLQALVAMLTDPPGAESVSAAGVLMNLARNEANRVHMREAEISKLLLSRLKQDTVTHLSGDTQGQTADHFLPILVGVVYNLVHDKRIQDELVNIDGLPSLIALCSSSNEAVLEVWQS
jgi:hypothetical protein